MRHTATALRRGFDAALKDQALMAEAQKAQIEIDPITGEEIEAMLKRLYALPDDIFKRVASFRQPASGEQKR